MRRMLLCALAAMCCWTLDAKVYDVREFGAAGDGRALDSPAINAAIKAASEAGGGQVYVPAGTYRCYSLHLASHIDLYLEKGARILAAFAFEDGEYDHPEPNAFDMYQDFGHSHWHNSLIWGENLEDVSISGLGMIDGEGLYRVFLENGEYNIRHFYASDRYTTEAYRDGIGNKMIALKSCRNVVIKDVTLYRGAHFILLATGVENMYLQNLKVDTYYDAFDIDCCRNVTVTGCQVNSAYDDGMVLKASYALGCYKDTENVTITGCNISGYALGTVLDGTLGEVPLHRSTYGHRGTGRIKLGTESSGGFKNISVSNCTLDYCGGILLESVDGGDLQDVVITNITMRNIIDAPIFIRLGARMRSPEGKEVGHIRRVLISDINSYSARPDFANIISGIPGHCIEDVTLRNIHLHSKGGMPAMERGYLPPEEEKGYPDAHRFGLIPAGGMFIRHAENITLDGVYFSFEKADARPLFVTDDVRNIRCNDIFRENKEVKIKIN